MWQSSQKNQARASRFPTFANSRRSNSSALSQWIPDPPELAAVERYLAAVEFGTYWPYIRPIGAEPADSRPSRARGGRTRLPWEPADSRPSLIRSGRIWPLFAPIGPYRPYRPLSDLSVPIGPYRPIGPYQPLSTPIPAIEKLAMYKKCSEAPLRTHVETVNA